MQDGHPPWRRQRSKVKANETSVLKFKVTLLIQISGWLLRLMLTVNSDFLTDS